MELFPDESAFIAKAGFAAGRLYERMGMIEAAKREYRFTAESMDNAFPESDLSRIKLIGMRTREIWKRSQAGTERRKILEQALGSLQDLYDRSGAHPDVRANCQIESARLLSALGKEPRFLLEAIK